MKEWSKEIFPLSRFKTLPEAIKLKMRFSGEEYQESLVKRSGPRQKEVNNPYMNFFKEFAGFGVSKLPRSVEDILVGVSRLNWYKSEGVQKPLSVRKIMYLLGKFDKIDRSKVEWMLDVKKMQALRYLSACELCIQHIDRSGETKADMFEAMSEDVCFGLD